MADGGQEPLPLENEVEEEFDLADILGQQVDEQAMTQQDRLRQLAEQVSSGLSASALHGSQCVSVHVV